MSADVFEFNQFAGSGRGLQARAYLPNNLPILRSYVQSISYEVYNRTDAVSVGNGSLDISLSMFDTPQAWRKDNKGFYILWTVPGILWPLPDKQYRSVLTVNLINPFAVYPAFAGKSFKLVWQANTKDPLT